MSTKATVFAVIAFVFASCAGSADPGRPSQRRSAERRSAERQLPIQSRWNAGIDFQKGNFRRVQRAIAQCMHERGFRYVPVPVATEYAESLASELSPGDFRTAFGYGIATARRNRLLLQPFGPPDPNEVIRRGLDGRELRSYARALWGDGTRGKTVRFRGHTATIFPSSCLTQALRATYGSQAASAGGSLRINASLNPFYEKIERDHRFRRALAVWRRCMRERGFEVAGFDDGREIVRRKAAAAQKADSLRRIQLLELRLARADARCRSGMVEDTIFEVRTEYEREFIARHERAIDALWPTK